MKLILLQTFSKKKSIVHLEYSSQFLENFYFNYSIEIRTYYNKINYFQIS